MSSNRNNKKRILRDSTNNPPAKKRKLNNQNASENISSIKQTNEFQKEFYKMKSKLDGLIELTKKLEKINKEQAKNHQTEIAEFKQEIHQLQKQNKLQKKNLSKKKLELKTLKNVLINNNTISENEITSLKHQNEHYRLALCASKNVILNLPSANINSVDWTKDNIFNHLTIRTVFIHKEREIIKQYPKYRNLKSGEYIIENNPLNKHCKNTKKQLAEILKFVEQNHIGNINPNVFISNNQYKSLKDVLSTRIITKCLHLKLLEGQKETYTKYDIDCGRILGQYYGNEMSKEEYFKIYNGTKEEMHHLTYIHGETLQINQDELELYIDGIAGDKSSPLLYLNDGRKDIMKASTLNDKKRINCAFVSVLVNGWPMILIKTTKKIVKNSTLWIDYGDYYGLVLDEQDLMKDSKQKNIKILQQILCDVDLKQQNHFDLSY